MKSNIPKSPFYNPGDRYSDCCQDDLNSSYTLTQVTGSLVFKTIRGINGCSHLSVNYRFILKIMSRYYLLLFPLTVALSGLISSSAFSQALKDNPELDEGRHRQALQLII